MEAETLFPLFETVFDQLRLYVEQNLVMKMEVSLNSHLYIHTYYTKDKSSSILAL